MSPHGSARIVPPPRLTRGHQPSFSAALLDAIYHSLEADAAAAAPASPAQRTPVSSRHRPTTPSLSRSGSCSSSTRSPRLQRPPRPCRVRPDPQPPNNSLLLLPPPPPPPHEPATGCYRPPEKTKTTCRKKSRNRKTKVAPLACIMNALLCNRSSAKTSSSAPTTPRAAPPAPALALEPPASARSILSSRASRRESAAAAAGGGILTPARRAVRFSPVAVVVDDGHGRGVARLRDAVADGKESAAEAERRVEELLRALGVAEERERAKESSESSSDLFELDGFPPAVVEDGEQLPPRVRVRSAVAGGAGMERPRPRV
ncbi:hypothetical protein PR202_ga02934 [Eleusine coracana subsp. coracana]|uniref:Uncharacterized protein n=1 Tax=Eleusine coracana subsp. coracana TaxID=191504 RepID=A0AAV5BN00_ELECO|nr:hypothetical protein PR202_ga02934 [Eleusine coracana subsp. coracana]